MVVAVLLALHDKLVVVPGQEDDRMERLHIFVIGLAVEFSLLLACDCVVTHESAVVLVAVEFKEIDGLAVGTPCRIGEIAVCRVTGLEIDTCTFLQVVDAQRHFVHLLTRHRIFLRCRCGDDTRLAFLQAFAGRRYRDQREVGDHTLVHACEKQFCAVRTPEGAFVPTEFVAVDALSVDDVARAVVGEGQRLACPVEHTELMIADVGCALGRGTVVAGDHRTLDLARPDQPSGLEIIECAALAVVDQRPTLVGKGEGNIVERMDLLALSATLLLYVAELEERLLLSRLRVDEGTLFRVELDGLVTPPGRPTVLGGHLMIVLSAEVQILKRKLLEVCRFLLCSCCECGHGQENT